MHTAGPRRYSQLQLCTTRQLEQLAREFCYDVDTLQNVSHELAGRTCRQSAIAKRSVDRQIAALKSVPPSADRAWISVRYLSLTAIVAVLLAVIVDQVAQWLSHV